MIIVIVVAVVVVGILALLLACLIKKCKKGKTDTVAPTEGEAVPKQIDVEVDGVLPATAGADANETMRDGANTALGFAADASSDPVKAEDKSK